MVRVDSSRLDEPPPLPETVRAELRSSKAAAEAKAERWRTALEVVRAADAEGREDFKADELETINAAEPLELSEIILTLPDFDPREQAGDCYFDEEAAREAIEFFHECLTFIEGEWAGEPFALEVWQQAIIANAFGWKRPDGLRRFREVFLLVPRKNGKSPLCAGIALLLLLVDDEPGAQVYSAAGDRDQAALIYRHASGMVEAEPSLASRCRCYRVGKSIEYRNAGSFFRALSAEAKTKHGLNVHGCLIDELHVQKNGELVDTLTSATGTRRQPMTVYITTRDFDRVSICNEKQSYAEKVASGAVFDSEYLPVLYQLRGDEHPEGAEAWDDPEAWRRCNPNFGVSIKVDEFVREYRKARHSPRARASFLRLRLNAKTSSEVDFVPLEFWDRCASPMRATGHDLEAWIELLGLEGATCYGGLDLSSNKDLTSFVLAFPDVELPDVPELEGVEGYEPGRVVTVLLPFFWAPAFAAELREQQEGVSYTAWEAEGWLELTPGNAIDEDRICQRIEELGELVNIDTIYFDRFGARTISRKLVGMGFELFKFGQGFVSMSPPMKYLETLWLKGALCHGGHPVLRWNASNVKAEVDAAENIKATKKKSPDRIDGFVASVMALAGIMDSYGDGAYDERGFVQL